jgi:hypothetical protein
MSFVFDHTNVTSTPSRIARGSQARSGQVSIMGREDMRSPGVKGRQNFFAIFRIFFAIVVFSAFYCIIFA